MTITDLNLDQPARIFEAALLRARSTAVHMVVPHHRPAPAGPSLWTSGTAAQRPGKAGVTPGCQRLGANESLTTPPWPSSSPDPRVNSVASLRDPQRGLSPAVSARTVTRITRSLATPCPLGRVGEPADARADAYLYCSEPHPYNHRPVITVAGGCVPVRTRVGPWAVARLRPRAPAPVADGSGWPQNADSRADAPSASW